MTLRLSLCRVPLRPFPRLTRLSPPCRPFHSSSRRSYNNNGFLGFLDDIPENTVFWGIIGLNAGVFTAFWWAKQKLSVERDPSMYRWMQQNFTANWRNISSGRVWTVFTSTFAHQDLPHIFFNGFTFYFMAPLTLSILGSRQFLFLYLGGGATAQLGSTAFTNIFQNGRDPYSLGASAAIYSTLSFLAFAAPRMTLLLYGIIPVPIWLAVSGIFAYDTYLTASDKGGKTNTSAHVGGILAGAGYFFLRRFRVF
ncbi:rhomboid-like protein 12, mitochondrial [Favolaschia claudopus]|uniref:Rhomboid-like protein 12, mitochondrial n=1 Tax=Favolaschia claudopus TaxID=2862362 RepID=A0AAW0EBD4_9AGAR